MFYSYLKTYSIASSSNKESIDYLNILKHEKKKDEEPRYPYLYFVSLSSTAHASGNPFSVHYSKNSTGIENNRKH